MILHLLFDDKFGDYAIRQFSDPKMNSEFVVITQTDSCIQIRESVRQIKEDSDEFKYLKANLGAYCAIVFHGLFYSWQAELLQVVPDHVKVAWVFWGGDIYGRSDLIQHFLSPMSKALFAFQCFKRRIRGISSSRNRDIFPLDILKRIDYCLTDVEDDFTFVKSYLGTPIKTLWYNYYSIEETIGDLSDEIVDGTNILIGNCCSLECNHLDGFYRLKQLSFGNSKVIVPLSYGELWLRSNILRIGNCCFGKLFCPIVDFLPRKEYNDIIKSCSVAIMPHYRPQAFGNILTALWLGTRVYLDEKNVLLPFFRKMGAVLFSIEHDLNNANPYVLQPLSKEEIIHNRKMLTAIYSKEVMHRRNLELVHILNR